jgi:hypothetical protein
MISSMPFSRSERGRGQGGSELCIAGTERCVWVPAQVRFPTILLLNKADQVGPSATVEGEVTLGSQAAGARREGTRIGTSRRSWSGMSRPSASWQGASSYDSEGVTPGLTWVCACISQCGRGVLSEVVQSQAVHSVQAR